MKNAPDGFPECSTVGEIENAIKNRAAYTRALCSIGRSGLLADIPGAASKPAHWAVRAAMPLAEQQPISTNDQHSSTATIAQT